MTLAAEAITVRAGARTLLDGVSVRLAPGRITAILGPNGAGKSTLLRTLAGLTRPHGGSVTLGGSPLGALATVARARRIGYLPQDTRAHWAISARTLVELGRIPFRSALGGAPGAADRAAIEAAMRDTDTLGLADRRVDSLSGGELARVMLARVLAGTPEWLLADEPFAALDIAHRHALAGPLRAAARGGQGVVIVLHDLSLALRLADDAVLLHQGRVVACGPAPEVVAPEVLEPVFGARFARVNGPDGRPDLVVAPLPLEGEGA